MTKRPSYQWYPGDFKRDTALQACCFEAQSLWRAMLDLMHDGEPYGFLTAGGVSIQDAQLARMIGVPVKKCTAWLFELEQRVVFSRTAEGVIYSRRMVRDGLEHDEWKAKSRRGGQASANQRATKEQPTTQPPVQPNGQPKGNTASASASALTTKSTTGRAASRAAPEREAWLVPVSRSYEQRKGAGSFPHGKAGKLLKPLHEAGVSGEEIAVRLGRYIDWLDDAKYLSLAKFRETFADYADNEPAALRQLAGYPDVVDKFGCFTAYGERVTRPPGLRIA